MRLVHIVAGSLGLASGAVALFALKGSKLHRKSGTIFVYAMLVMSASGAVMAARQPTMVVVMAGVLTSYLVLTALLTVRRRVLESHWTDAVGMLVALTVGVAGVAFGFEALRDISGKKDGHPAATYFIFGAVALLAALGDARMMLAHRIQGAQRIARHLWRMCFALGSGTMVAEAASQRLLAIPALMVLLTMFYWLARVWVMRRPVADTRSTAQPGPVAIWGVAWLGVPFVAGGKPVGFSAKALQLDLRDVPRKLHLACANLLEAGRAEIATLRQLDPLRRPFVGDPPSGHTGCRLHDLHPRAACRVTWNTARRAQNRATGKP